MLLKKRMGVGTVGLAMIGNLMSIVVVAYMLWPVARAIYGQYKGIK